MGIELPTTKLKVYILGGLGTQQLRWDLSIDFLRALGFQQLGDEFGLRSGLRPDCAFGGWAGVLGLGHSGVLTWLHRILGLAPRPLFVALRVVPYSEFHEQPCGQD